MSRIQWSRASQFNWVFDNLGGTPLMEPVAGRESGALTQVADDGRVYLRESLPGGGRVCYVRGVWRDDTLFPWQGFWAEPESGDLTDYFAGGGYVNEGGQTTITLGTALPSGTAVQVYYLYYTTEVAALYEALNIYPAVRRAYRSHDDFTYDFAVDRLLDLMATLHFAGLERDRNYGKMLEFLWDAFQCRQDSRTSPLFQDDFARSCWDRGAYVLYRNSTQGPEGFKKFAIALQTASSDSPASGEDTRALEVELKTVADGIDSTYAAWWGYGLNWSRSAPPFTTMDTLSLKMQSPDTSSRVTHLNKDGNGGTAVLRLEDCGQGSELRDYALMITQAGNLGEARFDLSVWDAQGQLQAEYLDVATAGIDHPIWLEEGLRLWWEPGAGTDFAVGDAWTFRSGDLEYHPRRLQVILNDSVPQESEPWSGAHTFIHALPDRFAELTPLALNFSQFWRIDNVIDDRDRRRSQWGSWYATNGSGKGSISLNDREVIEIIEGDTYYTQMQVRWDLPENTTAFGAWVGIDTSQVSSVGTSDLRLALKPQLSSGNTVTMRIKVKDANGTYFYREVTADNQVWNRVQVPWEEFMPEGGSGTLSHPIQVVDIGMTGTPPPTDGTFLVTDLTLGGHMTFADASQVRLLEFKYVEGPLALNAEHIWRLDDVSLNLEAADGYPFVPRLAISLGPYGLNAWRGPTLVHYAHPLAPWLCDRYDLATTYLHFHAEAQREYQRRYAGQVGAVLPVHTRNDIENISLCGEENFGGFCWWPRYRDYGNLVGAWHFNASLADGSGQGHDLAGSSGPPEYAPGLCQPRDTSVNLTGEQHLSAADTDNLDMGPEDFTIEAIFRMEAPMETTLVQKCADNQGYRIGMTPAGYLTAWVGDGANQAAITGSTNLADGNHHVVVLSFAANRVAGMKLFVDGLEVGTALDTTAIGAIENAESFRIGG